MSAARKSKSARNPAPVNPGNNAGAGKTLQGLTEYMEKGMPPSIFDVLAQSGEEATLFRCDGGVVSGIISENLVYDLKLKTVDAAGAVLETVITKVEILCICRAEDRDKVAAGQPDTRRPAQPLIRHSERNHIKNKTLFVLLMERQVAIITLLNGMIMKGLITGFNRYEINMHLKGGVPVTVLRHGVLAAENKTERSLLKTDQDRLKDWKKSTVYTIASPRPPSPDAHADKPPAVSTK